MTLLSFVLASTPRSVVSTVTEPQSKDVTVYGLSPGGAKVVARGRLASCPGCIESVASDGKRVLATLEADGRRSVYALPLDHGEFG